MLLDQGSERIASRRIASPRRRATSSRIGPRRKPLCASRSADPDLVLPVAGGGGVAEVLAGAPRFSPFLLLQSEERISRQLEDLDAARNKGVPGQEHADGHPPGDLALLYVRVHCTC